MSSSDLRFRTMGLLAPVAVCVSVRPTSATWVRVTSSLAPNLRTAASDFNDRLSLISTCPPSVSLRISAPVPLVWAALNTISCAFIIE